MIDSGSPEDRRPPEFAPLRYADRTPCQVPGWRLCAVPDVRASRRGGAKTASRDPGRGNGRPRPGSRVVAHSGEPGRGRRSVLSEATSGPLRPQHDRGGPACLVLPTHQGGVVVGQPECEISRMPPVQRAAREDLARVRTEPAWNRPFGSSCPGIEDVGPLRVDLSPPRGDSGRPDLGAFPDAGEARHLGRDVGAPAG